LFGKEIALLFESLLSLSFSSIDKEWRRRGDRGRRLLFLKMLLLLT
jgi:hypothetical protein